MVQTNECSSDYSIHDIKEDIERLKIETKYNFEGYTNIENFCKRNMGLPFFASFCYLKSFEKNHSNAVLLMPDYLKSVSNLHKSDILRPIKFFLSQPWAKDELEMLSDFFITKIVPLMIKNNLMKDIIDDVRKCDINIYAIAIDNEGMNKIGIAIRKMGQLGLNNTEADYVGKSSEQFIDCSEERRIEGALLEESLFASNVEKLSAEG